MKILIAQLQQSIAGYKFLCRTTLYVHLEDLVQNAFTLLPGKQRTSFCLIRVSESGAKPTAQTVRELIVQYCHPMTETLQCS